MTPAARSLVPVLPVLIALMAVPVLSSAIDASHGRDRALRVNYRQGPDLQRVFAPLPDRIDPLVIEIRGFCESPIVARGARWAPGGDVTQAGGQVAGLVGAHSSITITVNRGPAVGADCQP